MDNVTLVSMTSVRMQETIKALVNSSRSINYASIKLITHEEPPDLPDNIRYCNIPKINHIDEYSYNMIYRLGDYVDTDYALIVQHDGYVVNPEKWQNVFLEYDYIGAPFPMPNDSFTYRDANGRLFRVGNGGFSLRSKKLIDLPNELKLEWKSFHGSYNEDGFICVTNRNTYEEHGCKFAPLDVAIHFSHESPIPETENIIPFGFHGRSQLRHLK